MTTFQGIIAVCVCPMLVVPALAANSYNEAVNGNLSTNQSSPTPFTIASGTNPVIGSVGPGNSADWIAITVPAGLQLSSDVLAVYTSTDSQGFTGFQAGSAFVGNPETTASAYEGYTHFGTSVTNGSLPVQNLAGADLLPIMANPADAPGSQGFTPPLAAGTYTFLIQQLGAATSYEFDFGASAVPEPAALGLLGLGGIGLAAAAYKRRSR
ncbi:MAG TPA: PEP-CTERM sorting domain-containing protein [Pirellulales bacterium]|nr:PEP-CTERM sorting domain-containing protein [Pirellulales bacterium]